MDKYHVEIMRRKKEWFHKMGEEKAFSAPGDVSAAPSVNWGGECPAN